MTNNYVKIGNYRIEITYFFLDEHNYLHAVCANTVPQEIKSVSKNKVQVQELPISLTQAIISFIEKRKQQFPNFPVVQNAKFEDAVVEINKLLKKGIAHKDIEEVLKEAEDNDFWCRNLMTLTQINKKCKSGLTKYEHIWLMVISNKSKQQQKPKTDYNELR